jgi:HAMP domain-containing protein
MPPLFTKRGNRQARRFFKREGKKAKNFFTKTVPEIYDKIDDGVKETASWLEKNADEIGLLAGSVGAIATGDPTMVMKGAEMGKNVSQAAGDVNQMRGQLRKDLNQTGKNIARSSRNDPIEMPTSQGLLQGARQGLGEYGRNVLAQQQEANAFV